MNSTNNNKNSSRHSFLFWIILPLMLTWLGVNYLFGVVLQKPGWAKTTTENMSAVNLSITVPKTQYESIQKKSPGLVTFWFDDAWLSQYLVAAPLMRQAGFQAAIAVPTGVVGQNGYANWAQIRALEREGWEITNHSVAHDCTMEKWDSARIRQEILQARAELWRNRLASDYFVSPCGVESPKMLEEVKREFVGFRGTQDGLNDFADFDPYSLKVMNITNQSTLQEVQVWIDDTVKTDRWLILVFHQVGNNVPGAGEKYSITTDMFTSIIDYIENHGVQVVIPSQAFEFVQHVVTPQ